MAEGIVTTITGKPLGSFYIISRAIEKTEWDKTTGQLVIYFTDSTEPFRTGDLRGKDGSTNTKFTNLIDTPNTYAGAVGKYLRVNADETALEFIDLPTPIVSFLGLSDTPDSYTGQGLKGLRVNSAANAIEFYTMPNIPTDFRDLAGVPDSFLGQKNKYLKDLSEAEQRIIAYQEEIDNMQSEFMWSDSIKKAEMFRLATELKKFESNFEDEQLKLTINGIIAGNQVKEITPTYTIKAKKIDVVQKQVKFRILVGGGLGNSLTFDKPLFNGNVGFQNAKGNILRFSFDTEQRIMVGYDFSLFKISR
jgi:hypothetical protein